MMQFAVIASGGSVDTTGFAEGTRVLGEQIARAEEAVRSACSEQNIAYAQGVRDALRWITNRREAPYRDG